MTRDESLELNRRIAEIADDNDLAVRHGKAIPYIGWYWRHVDFTQTISLGDCGDFVGFMENNKWGYPEFTLTPEQDAALKQALSELACAPSWDKCRALWALCETFRPVRLPKPPHHPSILEQLTGVNLGGAS